jgi:arabinonate dehydratase
MSDTVRTRDTTVIRLHPADNVAIAVRRLPTGAAVANDVAAREPIPSGHKVAVAPIAAGEAVRRYGQVIGAATQPIRAGAHVHVHNLVMSQLRAEPELREGRRRNEPPRSFWAPVKPAHDE